MTARNFRSSICTVVFLSVARVFAVCSRSTGSQPNFLILGVFSYTHKKVLVVENYKYTMKTCLCLMAGRGHWSFNSFRRLLPLNDPHSIVLKRRVQTINDVREYIKGVVGARSTYRYIFFIAILFFIAVPSWHRRTGLRCQLCRLKNSLAGFTSFIFITFVRAVTKC